MSRRNKLTKRQMVRIIHALDAVWFRGRHWSFNRLWDYYKTKSKAQVAKHLPAYPERKRR